MKLNVNKQRGLWWSLSGAVILAGVIAMALSWNEFKAPLRPGLDFLGGTRLQLERDCRQPGNCDLPIDVADIRQVLQEKNLGANNIQILGKEAKRPKAKILQEILHDRGNTTTLWFIEDRLKTLQTVQQIPALKT
ncbi:MAG: hypothetical protein HC792_01040, partial [Acaryochloridaceae cyanobacterium CSU_5_19]|nr:hypothetical protein [Acaryochloridaceae cyanobacterium CSU_5_19]